MERVLRRPVESRRAYEQRRKTLAFGVVLALPLALALVFVLIGCGSVTSTSGAVATPPPVVPPLSAADVQNIVQAAATAADTATMVIAVVDRVGTVLAVYRKPGAGATDAGNFGAAVNVNDLAVALARTAAYFSNDQAPLSSRTVRFISDIHFPLGVTDADVAPLYGIENTNRGCTLATNFLPGQSVSP